MAIHPVSSARDYTFSADASLQKTFGNYLKDPKYVFA